MKRAVCFSFLVFMGLTLKTFALNAFDRSLIGGWGLKMMNEKEEFIRFGQDEVIVMNTLFHSKDFERAEDTIYIHDFEDDSVIIQYYLLSPNKLLFIMWNIDNPLESITLILSKL